MSARGLNRRRLWQLIRKEFRQTLRDPKSARLMFIAPVLQVLMFGYVVNTDVRHVRTFLVDRDGTVDSRQVVSALTGPGYFVASAGPRHLEVSIDYRSVPTEAPAGWPRIVGNEGIPGRFVYGFMVDRLRRVSEHVTIGSAARNGKDLGSWFLLTREA